MKTPSWIGENQRFSKDPVEPRGPREQSQQMYGYDNEKQVIFSTLISVLFEKSFQNNDPQPRTGTITGLLAVNANALRVSVEYIMIPLIPQSVKTADQDENARSRLFHCYYFVYNVFEMVRVCACAAHERNTTITHDRRNHGTSRISFESIVVIAFSVGEVSGAGRLSCLRE